jgi:hypothetical protein
MDAQAKEVVAQAFYELVPAVAPATWISGTNSLTRQLRLPAGF